MSGIEFVEHLITARVPQRADPTTSVAVPLTVRVDPLTGATARILTGEKLFADERPDLSELTARGGFCPFCEDVIEKYTGTLATDVTDAGRIRRGSAAVVPNVLAYSEFSSVGIYDTTRHFLDLPDFTPGIVTDLLGALVEYTRGVHRLRPMWSSLNANYLPPSGSSLVHPHAQSAHDEVGTTWQRQLVRLSAAWPGERAYWSELVTAEREGPRWITRRGNWNVFTPWAPVGFHEVWAVHEHLSAVELLTEEDCAELGALLSGLFGAYHEQNLTSFNYALMGGGPDEAERYRLLLRVVSRSNVVPFYRSDVTFFEKLHAEAMIDQTPEQVAEVMRTHLVS